MQYNQINHMIKKMQKISIRSSKNFRLRKQTLRALRCTTRFNSDYGDFFYVKPLYIKFKSSFIYIHYLISQVSPSIRLRL